MDKMESMPVSFTSEPLFRQLDKVAKLGALTPSQRREYDHSLKAYRDNLAIMQTERAEGRAEGLAKGLAKGRAEGRAEGAKREKMETIRTLRSMGVPEDQIAKIVRLSLKEIEDLNL